MQKLSFVAAGLIVAGLIGCEGTSTVPSTQPHPYAAYQPTSGQNISPGLAPYTHNDPNWPMDAGNGGGGGNAHH